MSDLADYELEDIVWKLGDNDDHIVPEDNKSGYAVERDNFKRSRIELKCTETNANIRASDNVAGRKGEESFIALKEDKERMQEKSSWTRSSNEVFPGSLNGEAKRKNPFASSDEERTRTPCLSSIDMKSAGSESCADDRTPGDQAFAADNNSKQCQLNDSSRTENDLSFFGNAPEDKSSNDLLFYGWPELENFEDVDDMLRSCDSTFGLDIDNTDDLSWFPPSHTIEGSSDALKSSFDFPTCNPCDLDTLTEQQEVYDQNSGMVVNESDNDLTPASCKRDLHKLVPDFLHFNSQSDIHSHVSPSKHQKSSQGKGSDSSLESGISFIHLDKLSEGGESNRSLNSQHSLSLRYHQQGEINDQPCLQSPMPTTKSDNHHPSNQVLSRSSTSIIKSEVNNPTTISPRESSQASNHMQSVESSHDFSFKNPSCLETKKKNKLHQRRLSRHTEKSNQGAQRADSDLVCTKKHIASVQSEGQSEVDGGDICFLGEQDSSTVQESSCMSSALDEVSVDARSLKQLQHAMVQLDMRTKLCIRDSLYRLARSAAQRHNCVNPSGVEGDDKDANGALLSDGTNKCTGFIDIETDTNPIDRSIAHLLFHRPSDPSAAGARVDTLAGKTHSVAEPPNPLTADKTVCREETTLANEEATEQRI